MKIQAQLFKIDEARRLITGVATSETPDHSDEIMDYALSKPNFIEWSKKIYKTSGGKSRGNLRSMHANLAAGKIRDLRFDDSNKLITITAEVVDDQEWKKVMKGVYTGFSIGGSYGKSWQDGKYRRYEAIPSEISLADYPQNPDSVITLVKANGSRVLIKGDREGHPFRGNQYTTGKGGATVREQRGELFNVKDQDNTYLEMKYEDDEPQTLSVRQARQRLFDYEPQDAPSPYTFNSSPLHEVMSESELYISDQLGRQVKINSSGDVFHYEASEEDGRIGWAEDHGDGSATFHPETGYRVPQEPAKWKDADKQGGSPTKKSPYKNLDDKALRMKLRQANRLSDSAVSQAIRDEMTLRRRTKRGKTPGGIPGLYGKSVDADLQKGGPGSGESEGHPFRGNQYTEGGGTQSGKFEDYSYEDLQQEAKLVAQDGDEERLAEIRSEMGRRDQAEHEQSTGSLGWGREKLGEQPSMFAEILKDDSDAELASRLNDIYDQDEPDEDTLNMIEDEIQNRGYIVEDFADMDFGEGEDFGGEDFEFDEPASEKEFESLMLSFTDVEEESLPLKGHVSTFEEGGYLTRDRGVVYRPSTSDSEFQFTVRETTTSGGISPTEVEDDLRSFLEGQGWREDLVIRSSSDAGYLSNSSGIELRYPDGSRYVIDIMKR